MLVVNKSSLKLQMEFFQLGVLIRLLWRCRKLMWVALFQMVVACMPFGKKLWKFQVPNKVRHFVWKAAKDILPTKTNSIQQHVIVDDLCEECGLYAESLFHLSMECPKAWEIWGFIQFSHLLSSMNFQSFMDFL